MGDEANKVKEIADALWQYFKPRIEEMLAGHTTKQKAVVTTAPSNGKVGVTFPFEDEITVPIVGVTVAVGDTVWVESPNGSPENYVVTAKGDFNGLTGSGGTITPVTPVNPGSGQTS